MDVALLRNMVAAHINLGEFQQAVAFGDRILETHGERGHHLVHLCRRPAERTARWTKPSRPWTGCKELDPEYPNISMRQGNWLLQEGRIDEAVPVLPGCRGPGRTVRRRVADQVFANGGERGSPEAQDGLCHPGDFAWRSSSMFPI